MKLNLKVRLKNPIFLAQILLALITPILAYMGLTFKDLTTWGSVWNLIISAISNPYIIGLCLVSVWNALTDPTTAGLSDSEAALKYERPKK